MTDDLLIPLGMADENAYLVLSPEDRLQSAAILYNKLLKCVTEWKAAVKRLDAINPRMPDKIVADIRDRWLTSIEEWTATRDSFMRLQLSQAEVETIARNLHHNGGLEEAARLADQVAAKNKDKAEDFRNFAAAIRKLQR
jgi:hypothetical protein